jgi:hypothetical protein
MRSSRSQENGVSGAPSRIRNGLRMEFSYELTGRRWAEATIAERDQTATITVSYLTVDAPQRVLQGDPLLHVRMQRGAGLGLFLPAMSLLRSRSRAATHTR